MATTRTDLVPVIVCDVCEEAVVVTVPAAAHPFRVCVRCLEGEQDILAQLREEEWLGPAPRSLQPWEG